MKFTKQFGAAVLIVVAAAATASVCSAQGSANAAVTTVPATQSTAPYTEGAVWEITMVKTKTGMSDDYLKALAKIFKTTNDEAKKQGIIIDYKILAGDSATQQACPLDNPEHEQNEKEKRRQGQTPHHLKKKISHDLERIQCRERVFENERRRAGEQVGQREQQRGDVQQSFHANGPIYV